MTYSQNKKNASRKYYSNQKNYNNLKTTHSDGILSTINNKIQALYDKKMEEEKKQKELEVNKIVIFSENELTKVLNKADLNEELIELAKILGFTENDITIKYPTKDKLIPEIEYWVSYYGESAFQKVRYKGSKISYLDILKKVAKILKLKISSQPNISEIEEALIRFSCSKLPDEQRKMFEEYTKEDIEKEKKQLKNKGATQSIKNSLTTITPAIGIQSGAYLGANLAAKEVANQTAKAMASKGTKVIIKAFFSKGFAGIAAQKATEQAALQSAARFGVVRTILAPIAGPVGIALLLGSIVKFSFSEAYSKIIPFTISIAILRSLQEIEEETIGI